jgi:hypothetical protein
MSQTHQNDAGEQSGEAKVRELIRQSFEPVTNTKQAVYHAKNGRELFDEIDRHHDGSHIQRWITDRVDESYRPFRKVLEQAARHEHSVYRFPEAFLDAVIHLSDREIYALERGDLDIFENASYSRRQIMEWLAQPEHRDILDAMSDGGTDIHSHSKPGRGKSSFMNMIGLARNVEINNETVLWMLPGGREPKIEEVECLPLAPFMTVAKPAGVDISVHAQPADYRLPRTEVALDDVFRDTLTYTDPEDLIEQVVPGGLYAVIPDPRFRRCEEIVNAAYINAWEAEEAAEVTPLRDFNHAVLTVRSKYDKFLHPTTMVVDEFGDLLPMNPEADEADTHKKTTEWPKTYAKGRKKNLSLFAASHSLRQIDESVLEKERWFATFPRTPVPSSTMSGLGDVPISQNYVRSLEKGQVAVWSEEYYCRVSWPNPYRLVDFQGEISIEFPEMRQVKYD